ncbi:uncharacterized protein I206_107236 [Kwoniella pini CBS 10737]|uniref:RING-type E3 ubiquitin transferase n=1 Tax=Kwoniella pini CBS 10737 TaxID=1296096 RepID=A0A1B9HYX3_9TREE|nr:uncharacterized protein I206_05219 [Kwoniella pini CBS 10737]OCF48441.1 hypothetical protein I206_05219 [Kwoniella pini CBS 10737]
MADFIPPTPQHNEDEGDVCRVCRVEGDEADPLIYPCKCAGSVRFVHPDCLKQWLAQTGKKHCEICGHKYAFTKIYPDQLPESIPITVYIRQTLLWLYRQQLWVARCILVVVTWLIVLPSINMFSLRSLLWIADHIGYTESSTPENSFTGNTTDISLSNATDLLNATVESNDTVSNGTRGLTVGDITDRPISTLFGIFKRAIERWMKGDENSAISFVLRGQILSISLAAVLIGLILLREWITQHNWQEGARPQIVEQGDIIPEEWMIVNGIARRTTDVMAALLGKARADRQNSELNRGQRGNLPDSREERLEIKEQKEEAALRRAQNQEEEAKKEQAGEVRKNDSFGLLAELKAGDDEQKKRLKTVATGLQEYVRSHQLAEQALKSTREEDVKAGEAFDQLMDQALAGRRPIQLPSAHGHFKEEEDGDAGPSRSRPDTNASDESRHPIKENDDFEKSLKERDEVAYKAPELLKKGKDREYRGETSQAGSNTGPAAEGDIPLFLPPSPTRTVSSASSPSNNVFRAGDTILFDERGNLIHDLPRAASPDQPVMPPRLPTPHDAENTDGGEDDRDWEDEPEAEIREIIENEMPPLGPGPGLEIRPVQVDFLEEEEEPWDRDDWNGILEVVGLMGPLHGLFQNVLFGVIIMSAAISIFVGLPLLIGKLFLSTDIIRTILSTARRTLHLIRKVTDPLVDIVFEIFKEVVALPVISSLRAVETILARKMGLGDPSSSNQRDILSRLFDILSLSASSSSPTAGALTGQHQGRYAGLFGDALAWLGQTAYDTYAAYVAGKRKISIGNTVSNRMFTVFSGYGVAAAIVGLIALPGENGGSISKELSKIVKDHAMFLKLAFFMILELGAFPLGIGLMIDGCTVPLWPGATILGRVAKLRASPFGVMFLDWLIGTMFMYQFATLLSHIRTLCRPGTLFFIRDPADPNYSPVKDIVEKSALSQLRKLWTSAVMYSVIVFTLFGASCWSLAYMPFVNLLPLKLNPTFGPLTSIPFDLLFLHLVVPPTVTYIRPRYRASKLMNIWWKHTISLFRLNTLMARRNTTSDHSTLDTRPNKLEKVWPILDPVYQVLFGKYNNESTKSRVPASDQVILLPPAQRKAEGGVFISLNENGVPFTPEDKLRLLKQDRRAREASRDPIRDYEVIHLPQYWRTRVHTFIGTTLVTSALVLAFGAFGPIVTGRLASGLLGGSRSVHDGYNWLFGAYIIYLSFLLGRSARRHIMTLSRAARIRRSARSTRIKRTLIKYLTGTYGLVTIYGVIPFFVGLLGDIYGSTFSWTRRDSAGGRIVVHFWDTWSIGIVICSLGVGLMSNLNKLKPTRGSLLDKLKVQFKKPFKEDLITTHKVVLPAIGCLLLVNLSPFAITSLVALITKGKYDDVVYQALLQAIIPLLFRIFIIIGIKQYLNTGWQDMRQSMIDAEYVVEERVENYDPSKEEQKQKKKNEKKKKGVILEEEEEEIEEDWEDENDNDLEEDEGEVNIIRDDVLVVE